MKVLIFYQYFGTPKGSWSTRFYEFSKRWVDAGHQVTVVTAPYEKSDIVATKFIERQVIEGINLIVINAPDSNRASILKRALNATLFSFTASWFAITQKTDIVISSSGPITIGIPGLIAQVFGKKFIFEVRDLWPGGGIEMGKIKGRLVIKASLFFEKYLYSKANLVVTCSDGQRNNIQKRFPSINCITIPHGGDIHLFGEKKSEIQIHKGQNIFTHIGSLGFIHNCKLILDAAIYIKKIGRENELKIIFIGDGAERKMLEEMKVKNGLTNVEFLGLKPKEELFHWLNNSTATLFTTLNNETQNTSCPNKIFDSFAAGVPIIQTTTGWIKTLIENENCGVNVPPENVDALAHAMLEMCDSKNKNVEMSKNAYRLAATDFSRDVLAKKYLTTLVEIANKN